MGSGSSLHSILASRTRARRGELEPFQLLEKKGKCYRSIAPIIHCRLRKRLETLSTWLLVISMPAIGMKAHLKDFATVGFKPILLMVSETVFLAILVVAFIFLAR